MFMFYGEMFISQLNSSPMSLCGNYIHPHPTSVQMNRGM